MAKIESYRELTVWQKAMALAADCDRLTASFPVEERCGLTSEIRGAAVSIPSNIAGGHNRRSRQAFSNQIGIALGSHAELGTQLAPPVTLGFTTSESASPARDLAADAGRLLRGLVCSLENAD